MLKIKKLKKNYFNIFLNKNIILKNTPHHKHPQALLLSGLYLLFKLYTNHHLIFHLLINLQPTFHYIFFVYEKLPLPLSLTISHLSCDKSNPKSRLPPTKSAQN